MSADLAATETDTGLEPVSPATPAEPIDTREAIRNAVAKQREGSDESRAVPREAKPAPQQSASERQRDESGRFAPGEPEVQKRTASSTNGNQPQAVAKTDKNSLVEPVESQPAAGLVDDAPRAPGSFSPTAKIAFDTAPPELRAAIAKREAEVNAGFAKYAGMDQYVKMAEQSGTSITKALDSYIGIERVLRTDPVAGIEAIAGNMGVHPVSLANAILAKHGRGGAPQQASQGQAQPQAPQPPLDVAGLENRMMQRFQADQARAQTASEIETFRNDPANRFFENVRSTMAALMQSGQCGTLKEAYDRSCWADPDIRAHLSAPQAAAMRGAEAVARAKGAAKAVTGAPSPGLRGLPPANETTHDTVRRAVEEARGSV